MILLEKLFLMMLGWLVQVHGARVQHASLGTALQQHSQGVLPPYSELHPWQQLWLQDVFPADFPRTAQALGNESQQKDAADAGSLAQASAAGHPWSSGATSEKLVGTGTFGNVYVSSFDCAGPWHAAVKVPKRPARDSELQELAREFEIQKKMAQVTGLSAAVLETRVKSSRVFALMEAADGGDLQHFITKVWSEGMANVDEGRLVQVIFAQLSLGLLKMHSAKIVHRDLKPHNILINKAVCSDKSVVNTAEQWLRQGCALKLTDFGLSCFQDKGCARGMMGTPAYMGPQQFEGKSGRTSMDIWAAGVILYQMLFGMHPYVSGFGLEKDMSEWKMALSPTSWWPWCWSHQTYWHKAKTVLGYTMTRDVTDTEEGRFTAEEMWDSDFVTPMQPAAVQADLSELNSPLRKVPACVLAFAKGWGEGFMSRAASWLASLWS